MISPRAVTLLFVILAGGAGAVALGARGQTARPGDMTQSRVWVENRSRSEAIPVVVENVATPVTVHLDSTSSVQTFSGRQIWEYRSIPLGAGADPTRGLSGAGGEGWEAVGVLQSGATGATVLLKRPR
jgi:hypothetical protein